MTAKQAYRDPWAEWLLHSRFSGDRQSADRFIAALMPIREQVLANANIRAGDTLLDVGCGDGLIGFGALALVGENGRVIFADISDQLLEHCRNTAAALKYSASCRYINAAAEKLSPVPDNSVDVVTTRSVLIYVADKEQALREFMRVLKPGGHLSIFEPINKFARQKHGPHSFMGYDLEAVKHLAAKVSQAIRKKSGEATQSMIDFDERDLFNMADDCGFVNLALTYQAGSSSSKYGADWSCFLTSPPNPLSPSLQQAMDEALTESEQQEFSACFRRQYEGRKGKHYQATMYLAAQKPAD